MTLRGDQVHVLTGAKKVKELILKKKKNWAVPAKFFLYFVYQMEFVFLGFHEMLTCRYLPLNLSLNPILSELNCSRHSCGVVYTKFI